MTVINSNQPQNNQPPNNVDNQNQILNTLPAPQDPPVLNNAAQAQPIAVYSFDWVFSRLPSFTQIKDAVAFTVSIGSHLWDPTPVVVEKIKGLLPLQFSITRLLLPVHGEDNRLLLKILSAIEHVFLPNELHKVSDRFKLKERISQPPLPAFPQAMVERIEKKIVITEERIKKRQVEYDKQPRLQKIKTVLDFRAEQSQDKKELKKAANLLEGHQGNAVLIPGKRPHFPEKEPHLDKGKEILHDVLKTVLNQLSVEKNLGNLISFVFKKLAKVTMSIQDIDLINSESVGKDFIKTLTGNANIDIKEFEKKQEKKLRDNFKELSKKIVNKVNKGDKSGELSFLRTSANSIISKAVLAMAPESLIEKIFEALFQVLLDEAPNLLLKVLKEIPCLQSCGELKDVLKLYEEMLDNGAQLGSVNIKFPEAAHLTQEQFSSLKNNFKLLARLVLHTLTAELVKGLAKYVDWETDPLASSLVISEDHDRKILQKNVKKNFTDLVSAVQSTLNQTFTEALGKKLEFHRDHLELSRALMIVSWICFFGQVWLRIMTGSDEFPLVHAMANIFALIDSQAILSNVARGTLFTTLNLVSAEIKRIDVTKIIPVITEYLREIAKT
jgi:hypothetical protein